MVAVVVVVVRDERHRVPPDPEPLRVLAPDPLPLEGELGPVQARGDVPDAPIAVPVATRVGYFRKAAPPRMR